MGLLKKFAIARKPKSSWNLADETPARLPVRERERLPERRAPLEKEYLRPRPSPPLPSFSYAPTLVEKYDDEEIDAETDIGQILIGIDFGTTYSGVAWAYSKQPEDINIITNWDCTEYESSDKGKAPTRISYEQSSSNEILWGYNVGDKEAVEWFKLLLLDEEEMDAKQRNSPQIKQAKELLRKAGKTAVQAVTDYLRLLWAHAVSNIEKAFGEATVEGLPFQIVCTVPAVWTTQAVNKMREAAKDAGILEHRIAGETTLNFVSEPEAAALATFDDLKARPNFQVGDTFVVCDAGGGTVDLISYQVSQTKPMRLSECVEGSGKLCGAVFLDQDFEAFMKQLVGEAWDVPDSVIKGVMSAQWENGIKRGFEDQDRNWKITLPYDCVTRGAPPFISLDRGHVREIFDDVVSQVRSLVNDQVSAVEEKTGRPPKAVVLVGGFGSCRYLFNLLRVENRHRGIEVYQSSGNRPWTAICRGAVLKALTNSLIPGPVVHTRISRCSYGIRYHTMFDSDIHLACDKYRDEVSGRDKARNQLRWYLKRGDNISDAKPVRMPWHANVPVQEHREFFSLGVLIQTCKEKDPPARQTALVRPGFRIESDEGIKLANIRPHKGADGRFYKRIDFEIEMKVIGTALEFALMYQGQRIGHSQTEAEVDTKW
ncbi:actin-like ATPase domain-containing protein [Dothidotthia symphoricarpi CBS 119687]|uniref:Actin-like ATPase domain-containing protein n=1 Tax=Dothidotthia symphoricarpi CBS 119687 TaxID=1392245 RepID=A0A6A6AAG5_9PLEO|nr:actin-like ATPase domain-containing protein [Dothidotthia symphoricarpi CBS 119687]KAF2127837.1 actin-like ATPase domain-containing protein [Dothidotthia symphoricarpi CBS 119687]